MHMADGKRRSGRSLLLLRLLLAALVSIGWGPTDQARAAEKDSDPAASGAEASEPSRPAPGEETENKDRTGPEAPLPSGLVEEVVVRGDLARDRDTPATFTDVAREEIELRHRGQDLGMLLGDTPNAYAYSDAGNGVGYSYFSLRGFDQRRIAVSINGVPLNTPEEHQVYYIDLADFAASLDRIQVQRGTGTALYGSPAVGGVVNLETGHLPTTEGGQLEIGYGSFDTRRIAFRYGGPIAGGRWAWMVRAARVRSDGYRRPSWTRHAFYQISFERFAPDSLLRIHVFGGPERTQLAYFGVPKAWLEGGLTGDPDEDRRVNPLRPGETDSFVQPHLQVLHDWHVAPGVFVRNTVYAIQGRGFFKQFFGTFCYDPEDPAPGERSTRECAGEPNVSDAWLRRWIGERQFGWIPRVSWDHRGGSLSAGAQVMLHRGRHEGRILEGLLDGQPLSTPAPLYDYWNRKTTTALFVRESLRPDPRLTVNLELQATSHRLSMTGDRVGGRRWRTRTSFLTPRVGLNWNLDDRWNLYASLSTARSDPPFSFVFDPENPQADPASFFATCDPDGRDCSGALARSERLRDYEAGAGYARGPVRLKANFYRMEFRDEFVPAGGLDRNGLPILRNAGRSVHEGIELEGETVVGGAVELGGYVAASRDVLRDYRFFRTDPVTGEPLVVDESGNRIAFFPDHLARVRIGRRFGPAKLVLGARRIGRIFLDNSENERKNPGARLEPSWVDKKIPPFTLFDLVATVDLAQLARGRSKSLALKVHLDNLFDKRYAAFGYSYPNPYGTELPGWCSRSFCSEFIPGSTRNLFVGMTVGF
jgi:iron complex outermembrane receptor protein